MLNILYIRRHPNTRNRPYWITQLNKIRDAYYLHNRDGFFRASLHTHAKVTTIGIEKLKRMSSKLIQRYDIVIVHFQCNYRAEGDEFEVLHRTMRTLKSDLGDAPLVLLATNANAGDIPPDATMDLFDLVFKREHYRDLGRYLLSSRNRDKLRTTVLSCPLVPATILNYNSINPAAYGFRKPPALYERDLFFAGMDTSEQRRDLVQAILDSGLNFSGGIHKKEQPVPEHLQFPRMPKKKFYQTIHKSKVNLAIEGYGQFTYRHWELWALSAFMISSPSIRELQLPFEPVEGKHYVAYENVDDLIDKIRYYLDKPAERERMLKEGRSLFESAYDFHKHGSMIHRELRNLL